MDERAALMAMLALAACGTDGQVPIPNHDEGAVAADWPGGAEGGVRATAAPECRVDGTLAALPAEIRESSGLARGRSNSALFWTHNDAGNPAELFALDGEGNLVGRVRVDGVAATDWEDIESAPCPGGDCLYVADTGNNGGERESLTIYQVTEPREPFSSASPVAAVQARFPDGRWDAEALFALPDGSLYIVTKGRSGPITLYAVPTAEAESGTSVLRRIRDLLPPPADDLDRVTAATATPDGRWVVLRTYRALLLYRAQALVTGVPVGPAIVDLTGLGHPQGESVAMSDDGWVWLTSESGGGGTPALWSRLRCDLPAE